jgi:CBS domain containing-hemolysin-like protein
VVPETKPLSQMLEEFRRGHSHMAMVVDEFGTIVGMLTVEDVLEEVVGQIEDEHDEKIQRRAETDELELDGATRIRDLENEFGIEIPTDQGFETLAGFLLARRGEIPQVGDAVDHNGRRYTVTERERNRVARVRIEKLPEQPVTAAG